MKRLMESVMPELPMPFFWLIEVIFFGLRNKIEAN